MFTRLKNMIRSEEVPDLSAAFYKKVLKVAQIKEETMLETADLDIFSILDREEKKSILKILEHLPLPNLPIESYTEETFKANILSEYRRIPGLLSLTIFELFNFSYDFFLLLRSLFFKTQKSSSGSTFFYSERRQLDEKRLFEIRDTYMYFLNLMKFIVYLLFGMSIGNVFLQKYIGAKKETFIKAVAIVILILPMVIYFFRKRLGRETNKSIMIASIFKAALKRKEGQQRQVHAEAAKNKKNKRTLKRVNGLKT